MRTSRYWRMLFTVVAATTLMNGLIVYAANKYWDNQEPPQRNSFLDKTREPRPLSHIEASRINQRFGKCDFMGTLDGKRTIGVFDCKGIVTMEFLNE